MSKRSPAATFKRIHQRRRQILVAQRWRGLRSRADFLAMQASDRPIVLAMHRPEQRARAV